MKNLIIPIDHLVMLAELDDKEARQMAKAIAQYANKETAPSFSIDRRLVCLSCHLNFGWNDGEFLFLKIFHINFVFCGLSPGLN